jgi:hypothetical protein
MTVEVGEGAPFARRAQRIGKLKLKFTLGSW